MVVTLASLDNMTFKYMPLLLFQKVTFKQLNMDISEYWKEIYHIFTICLSQ